MKKFLKGLAGVIVLVVIAMIGIGLLAKKDDFPSSGGTSAARVMPPMPADEQAFIQAVERGAAAYKAGANEMAKGASRPARAKDICAVIKGPAVRDWVGVIDTLSSNSDGKGVLGVKITRVITMKTWNNAVSDAGDRTLIEPGSPLFNTAAAMKPGAIVYFSGTVFRSDVDCMRETSLTIGGSMEEPEFLIRFTSMRAAE